MDKRGYIFVCFILIIVSVFFANCRKDKEDNTQVPTVYVDIYLDLNSTQYTELNSVGGWVYLTGGYQGILVYRSSMEEFMAYDRTCTLQSDSCLRITVENSGLMVIDSACGSQFIILDGTPAQEGPATIPLKRYRTSFDGITLHIYN